MKICRLLSIAILAVITGASASPRPYNVASMARAKE
jgi:hypothetical protein